MGSTLKPIDLRFNTSRSRGHVVTTVVLFPSFYATSLQQLCSFVFHYVGDGLRIYAAH